MHQFELTGMFMRCVGPHGSATVNRNSTEFIDIARSHGLRVVGSWFQHPQAHHWTWYSNGGGVVKEIAMCLLMVTGG